MVILFTDRSSPIDAEADGSSIVFLYYRLLDIVAVSLNKIPRPYDLRQCINDADQFGFHAALGIYILLACRSIYTSFTKS